MLPLARSLSAFALAAAAASALAHEGAQALTAAQLEALAAEVTAAETAFAKTMADRQLDRFAEFVAADAVFSGAALLIGRPVIVDKWRPLFDGPRAPFSWAPDKVTVAADGRTAVSTGPVRDPEGRVISRFMTIWRKDTDGRWRAAVDQGVDLDACPPVAK
jgi:ketosteroid isomerase-like protein